MNDTLWAVFAVSERYPTLFVFALVTFVMACVWYYLQQTEDD